MKSKDNKSYTKPQKSTEVAKVTQRDSYKKREVKVEEKNVMDKQAGDRGHRKLTKESHL